MPPYKEQKWSYKASNQFSTRSTLSLNNYGINKEWSTTSHYVSSPTLGANPRQSSLQHKAAAEEGQSSAAPRQSCPTDCCHRCCETPSPHPLQFCLASGSCGDHKRDWWHYKKRGRTTKPGEEGAGEQREQGLCRFPILCRHTCCHRWWTFFLGRAATGGTLSTWALT